MPMASWEDSQERCPRDLWEDFLLEPMTWLVGPMCLSCPQRILPATLPASPRPLIIQLKAQHPGWVRGKRQSPAQLGETGAHADKLTVPCVRQRIIGGEEDKELRGQDLGSVSEVS